MKKLLNVLMPYKTGLLLSLMLSLLISAFMCGHKIAKTDCTIRMNKIHADFESSKTVAIENAIAEHVLLQNSLAQTVDNYQINENNAKAEVRVIEREVIKYVQKNPDINTCTLPPAGVQLVTQMVGSANRGRDPRAKPALTY